MDPQERLTVQPIPLKVGVLLPAYNEEQHIAQCLRETREAFPSALLIVVDNNSTDRTAELAAASGALVLHEPSPGKGRAVTTGVQAALAEGCAWIALHDADNEYNAAHLGRLVTECQHFSASDLVMGVGLREVVLGHVLWRSILANYLARTALWLALRKKPPSDILTGARVMSAALATKLFESQTGESRYKGFELETALTRQTMALGAQLVSAPVQYSPRAVVEKKIKAWDILGILKAAWKA